MIEQQGMVTGLHGFSVQVRVGPVSGCQACDQGRGCGAGVFGRLLWRKPVVLTLENTVCAVPGDTVRVGIPEVVLLRLVSRSYLVPLLGGLGGAAIGHHLGIMTLGRPWMIDLAALAGAACGAGLCLPRRRTGREPLAAGAARLIGAGSGHDAASCAANCAESIPVAPAGRAHGEERD